jgi:FixJ family two-component response regulator
LVRKQVRELIHEAVGKLTPQQKAVFKMSREEGLKQEDIARQLNISIFTVKKHLTDALNYLRKEITDSYGSQAITICIMYGIALQLDDDRPRKRDHRRRTTDDRP